MSEKIKSRFEGGPNIALKIPRRHYTETVRFYRETLGLQVTERDIDHPTVSRTHEVKFGQNILWLDCVDNYSHTEVWMELTTPDLDEATAYLAASGTRTCDELEHIPPNAHWITDPAGTVFILQEKK